MYNNFAEWAVHASGPTEKLVHEENEPNVHEEKQSRKYFCTGYLCMEKNLDLKAKRRLTNVEQLGKTLHPGKAGMWKCQQHKGSATFHGTLRLSNLSLGSFLCLSIWASIEPWEGNFQCNLLVLFRPFNVLTNDLGNWDVGSGVLMVFPKSQKLNRCRVKSRCRKYFATFFFFVWFLLWN